MENCAERNGKDTRALSLQEIYCIGISRFLALQNHVWKARKGNAKEICQTAECQLTTIVYGQYTHFFLQVR